MKFYFLFIIVYIHQVTASGILCSKQFCEEFTADKPCNELQGNCKIQNTTHNGLFLPYPLGPCNCCDYCLQNIDEGDFCSVGDDSSAEPSNICGPLLACDANYMKCGLLKSACTDKQIDYDNRKLSGDLGHLEVRPECDRNGYFAPYVCIPGEICYCVDEDGNRIFGEIPYTTYPGQGCSCSRKYENAKKTIGEVLHASEHFRCTANGNYDSLQCINDMCGCVDKADGAPTYPDQELLKMEYISPAAFPCYDNKSHAAIGSYYFECEENYVDMLKDVRKYENDDIEVIGTKYPNCQLDGKYAPVQEIDNKKVCVAPNGKQLENFSVDITDPLAETMDCKCARARSIITSREKPTCCQNGNYAKLQCRRDKCRCVDNNGIQIEKEVPKSDISKLHCTENECTQA